MIDEEKKGTCRICGKDMGTRKEFEEANPNLKYINGHKFNPGHCWQLCSYECASKAIEFNACWKMKNKLKNMSGMSFKLFQEAFNMPEAGCYAREKYNYFVSDPLLFINLLDIENFKKFMEMKA